MWKLPVIIVNFKLYDRASGKNAIKLAKILEEDAIKRDVEIVAALNAMDLPVVRREVSIPLILQHADAVDFGAHTGRINMEIALEYGADGILINHSERRLNIADIDYLISKAREMNLISVVCANNPRVSGAIAFLEPDFIAMEPPELIGGNISVSKARPEAITETLNTVKSVRNIPVLVGAGVKSSEDVKKAIELGAKGILVASGVTKAKNPRKAIDELIDGLI